MIAERELFTLGKNERLRTFGARLRQAREDKGFRYGKDFANAVGISPQYLSGIEKGYNTDGRPATVPDDDLIEKMAEVLELPAHYLHEWMARPSAAERVPAKVIEFYENAPPEVTDPVTQIVENVFSMMDRGVIPANSGKERD